MKKHVLIQIIMAEVHHHIIYIPFDISFEKLQTELWNIGNKYGISGPEVFKILMDNFPKKGG